MVWRIGLIGFGNVGQGFIRVLRNKERCLRDRFGFEFKLIAIADPIKGNAYSDEGLDLNHIIELVDEKGNIWDYPGEKDFDSITLAKEMDVDIIVEATPTNIETGEPGLTHIKTALENSRHVVTSNKGPIALAYRELIDIARKNNVFLRFEGTVMSGTPAISIAREALAGCNIQEIQGILNGTTNFILTKMENGYSYSDALKEAQRLGYAETDPTADVEGWDAAVKTVILANTVLDSDLKINDVERMGITGISGKDVKEALKNGMRIKLIARIYTDDGVIKASVKPMKLPLTNPLANVMGVLNAITFKTDHLGDVTLIGPGAGRIETGQALLSDILYIHRLSQE
ncbi:homoserine dehydrogenase [Candidatus Geothermarchaeota archaeon]|nr:MAG: homoserine dehydrogenase [Candidatus Geothermarchaeota archaeon]HEW94350.1 homoserine dehydrogenase [Thermoprotei archaeon]